MHGSQPGAGIIIGVAAGRDVVEGLRVPVQDRADEPGVVAQLLVDAGHRDRDDIGSFQAQALEIGIRSEGTEAAAVGGGEFDDANDLAGSVCVGGKLQILASSSGVRTLEARGLAWSPREPSIRKCGRAYGPVSKPKISTTWERFGGSRRARRGRDSASCRARTF